MRGSTSVSTQLHKTHQIASGHIKWPQIENEHTEALIGLANGLV